MYSLLTDSFTPTAIVTIAVNYVAWTHFSADSKIQKIFSGMCFLNAGIAITLFYIEYSEETRYIISVTQERTQKIALHAFAIGVLGVVVSHWRFTCLSNSFA